MEWVGMYCDMVHSEQVLQYICMLLFLYSHMLHCNTYVSYYFFTIMCYIATHICMLLFLYSHVLHCNTYVCYYL